MLTQSILKKFITYNDETGCFTWVTRSREHFKTNRAFNTWNARWANKEAGTVQIHRGKHYASIRVMYKRYLAHRLAWLYVYGEWPVNEVDHIDGNGANNAILNLRDVTSTENSRNIRLRDDNTSGTVGVYWCKTYRVWKSQIMINKKNIYLGGHHDKKGAIKARAIAEVKHGFHKNHGDARPL